jgi:hypothetical protein
VPEPGLADKVVRLHDALAGAGIPHAFGGALALAYYAEPRVTVDIDVNVFVDPARFAEVAGVLRALGVDTTADERAVLRDGQVRLWWGRNPLDLFFSYDAVHDAMQQATRTVPFGDHRIPVLAPEHLLVAKAVFNRAKDWLDIEQMLLGVPAIDMVEVYRWLDHLIGPDDPRRERLRQKEREILGA